MKQKHEEKNTFDVEHIVDMHTHCVRTVTEHYFISFFSFFLFFFSCEHCDKALISGWEAIGLEKDITALGWRPWRNKMLIQGLGDFF